MSLGFDLDVNQGLKISYKWLIKKIDCSLSGINKCHGKCCYEPIFWPGKVGEGGKCHFLLDFGCSLQKRMRPVTCLLYPFLIRNNTLILHFRALQICKVNYIKSELSDKVVIEETIFGKNKDNLIILFGKKNVNRIEKNLLLKKDTMIIIDKKIIQLLNEEKKLYKEDKPYKPRLIN